MHVLRFWQSLSLLLAGLALWLGLSWREVLQQSAEVREGAAADFVHVAVEVPTSRKAPIRPGRPARAQSALPPKNDVVRVPRALALRLSEKIGSPLQGSPPGPLQWDRDQLELLVFTDEQFDALNSAAIRATALSLAEMKRVIRPLKPDEHGQFAQMEEQRFRSANWQRFLIPDWHRVQAAGRELLKQEALAIAGPDAVTRLFPPSNKYWANSAFDRILSVQDDPESGWIIADELVSEGYTSLTNIRPGKELPAHWKSLFQVTETPAPANVGRSGE